MKKEYFGFILAGSIGFLVDSGFFFLTKKIVGLVSAKALSFLLASFITWIINRLYTFQYETKNHLVLLEYLKYFLGQLTGATVNMVSFLTLISFSSFLKSNLLIPICLSTGIAMIFNFRIMKKWIFK